MGPLISIAKQLLSAWRIYCIFLTKTGERNPKAAHVQSTAYPLSTTQTETTFLSCYSGKTLSHEGFRLTGPRRAMSPAAGRGGISARHLLSLFKRGLPERRRPVYRPATAPTRKGRGRSRPNINHFTRTSVDPQRPKVRSSHATTYKPTRTPRHPSARGRLGPPV